jgi:hypothetical protein
LCLLHPIQYPAITKRAVTPLGTPLYSGRKVSRHSVMCPRLCFATLSNAVNSQPPKVIDSLISSSVLENPPFKKPTLPPPCRGFTGYSSSDHHARILTHSPPHLRLGRLKPLATWHARLSDRQHPVHALRAHSTCKTTRRYHTIVSYFETVVSGKTYFFRSTSTTHGNTWCMSQRV